MAAKKKGRVGRPKGHVPANRGVGNTTDGLRLNRIVVFLTDDESAALTKRCEKYHRSRGGELHEMVRKRLHTSP